MEAEVGMLIVETIAKIRRAFFVQGKSIKAICRELRVSRKVVRKVVRSEATEFRYEREAQRFRLGKALTEDELKGARGRDNPVAVEKKNVSAVAASKKLTGAKSIIKGVGHGVFPTFSRRKGAKSIKGNV
jgi:hypothetical protein